jgi:hypothetical protein
MSAFDALDGSASGKRYVPVADRCGPRDVGYGTKLPIRNVRVMVAIGGKADLDRTALNRRE